MRAYKLPRSPSWLSVYYKVVTFRWLASSYTFVRQHVTMTIDFITSVSGKNQQLHGFILITGFTVPCFR